MHKIPARANALLVLSMSCISILMIMCALSSLFFTNGIPNVTIDVHDVSIVTAQQYPRYPLDDRGSLTFSITADMSSQFNWNVRQLFLYVVAEYTTKKNSLNKVVVWDHIMRRTDNQKLNLKKKTLKYKFFDDGNGLRGSNVTFTLHWNVIPVVGVLPQKTSGMKDVVFPLNYATDSSSKYK